MSVSTQNVSMARGYGLEYAGTYTRSCCILYHVCILIVDDVFVTDVKRVSYVYGPFAMAILCVVSAVGNARPGAQFFFL